MDIQFRTGLFDYEFTDSEVVICDNVIPVCSITKVIYMDPSGKSPGFILFCTGNCYGEDVTDYATARKHTYNFVSIKKKNFDEMDEILEYFFPIVPVIEVSRDSYSEVARHQYESAISYNTPPRSAYNIFKKIGISLVLFVAIVIVIGQIWAMLNGTEILNGNKEPNKNVGSQEDSGKDGETAGQKNARRSAVSYIKNMPFSHDGLVQQLTFEGYTPEEAIYGADNCGADWNEQALNAAKNYLNISAFSYTGLKKQLEFEQFTSEQAEYGADNCGADWNEQAAKKAKEYLDMSPFSKDGLISQLEFEGFTHEQAVHGVESNGF